MNGPDTDKLSDQMQARCIATLAADLAVAEILSPYMNVSSEMTPAECALHIVNDAARLGRLGFLDNVLHSRARRTRR